MLSQGSEFYQRLVEHLTILRQNVSDFKNARGMQANDLCQQIGVAAPQQLQPMPAFVPNVHAPGAFNYGYDPNMGGPPQGGPPQG